MDIVYGSGRLAFGLFRGYSAFVEALARVAVGIVDRLSTIGRDILGNVTGTFGGSRRTRAEGEVIMQAYRSRC